MTRDNTSHRDMVTPSAGRNNLETLWIETDIETGIGRIDHHQQGMGSTNQEANPSAETSPREQAAVFPARQSLPLILALFGFWVLLSGKLDAFHLAAGAIASIAIGWYSAKLFQLAPAIGRPRQHPLASIPILGFATYLPWLTWQILVATLQVVKVVWSPTLPVRPRLFWTRCPLPHNVARLTLANSITLTPGTVTLDVRGDDYLVHALTEETAEDLRSEDGSDMKQKVQHLYKKDISQPSH